MAHILCMTSGLRGLLNASFELVARLEQAGHRVTYACPHDVGDAVRAQGIDYVQLPAANFNPAPPPAGSRITQWRTAGERRRAGVIALGMAAFRDAVDTLDPDLVLLDCEMYEHVFTLHASGRRFALITPWFPTWRRSGLPPLTTDIIPNEGWRGSKAGLAWTWLLRRCRRRYQITKVSLKNTYTERRRVLLQYARDVGYPVAALEQCGAHTMFVDTHAPTLLLTARELDFAHTPREGTVYVGPMVSLARVEDDIPAEVTEALNAVLSDRGERKLLYAPGTTMAGGDASLARRLMEAVRHRADWLLVLTGLSPEQVDKLDLPDNAHAFDYVPQPQILPQADLCIAQAGINTVYEALDAGTRLLVFPVQFDQPGVAARLVHHGLAHRGDVRADDAGRIATRIEAALQDASLDGVMTMMREKLQRYALDKDLEQVVAALLQGQRI